MYASILLGDTEEEVRSDVRRCLEDGLRAVKLGWGPWGTDPMGSVALVEAARDAAGEDVDIMVDVGFGGDVHQAIQFARALESLGVFFLEEPLSPDNLGGYAELASKVDVAIATGEKESTVHGFRRLIEIGRVDIVQPDVARAGGIAETKKIVDFARAAGGGCIPHCWSSDILLSATWQLVSGIPAIPFVEFCTLKTPLRRHVTQRPIEPVDGMVSIPEGPGIGVDPNTDTLAKYRVDL